MPLRGGVGRLMANAILNVHFDYPHPSLTHIQVWGTKPLSIFSLNILPQNSAWQIHNPVEIKILKLRHLLKESGSYPYFKRLEHKACKEWSRIFQRQKVTATIWYSNTSKISYIECNIWNTKYFNVSAFWIKYPSTDALTPCHLKWQYWKQYWANLKLKIQGNTDIQNITKEKEQKRSALRGNLIQLTSVQHAPHKKKSPPAGPRM